MREFLNVIAIVAGLVAGASIGYILGGYAMMRRDIQDIHSAICPRGREEDKHPPHDSKNTQ